MGQRKVRTKAAKGLEYEPDGDYEPPRPAVDRDADAVAAALSKLSGREQTGWVTNWRPKWLLANLPPFRFYFFQDKLVMDLFALSAREAEAGEFTTPQIEAEISVKTSMCAEHDLIYLPVRPEDELQTGHLAARLGKLQAKKQEEVGA